MKSLESRIAALEQQQQSADKAEIVILRAMLTALRNETSKSGNSSAPSLLAEYTLAPASLTTA